MADLNKDNDLSRPNTKGLNDEELSNISPTRTRGSSNASARLRSASNRFLESAPPSGMWHATGQVVAKAPTPAEIRKGAFSHDGWDEEVQRRHSVINEENVRKLTRTASYQQQGGGSPATPAPLHAHAEEDEDDPFDKFVGRGKMANQSFSRSPKDQAVESVDPLSDGEEKARTSSDSLDSIDALEGRTVRKPGTLSL